MKLTTKAAHEQRREDWIVQFLLVWSQLPVKRQSPLYKTVPFRIPDKVSRSDQNRWRDVDLCPVSGRSILVQGFQYTVDFYHQKGDFPSHKDFSTLHNTKRKEYRSRQLSHMTRKYTRIHITVLQPTQQQTQPLKRHSPFSRPNSPHNR